jgi:flagellar basal-body rod protein FlgC
MFDIMKISSSGMRAQRTRLEVVAQNMANVHTTRTEEGGPYRKKDVVLTAQDVSEAKFSRIFGGKVEGVKVEDVIESAKPFERIQSPGHPDADKEGYLTLPNVNIMEEMTDMISATRAYEANSSVLQTTKQMVQKSLEIAR